MILRPLPAPILPAIAHGVTACGIVALIAALWTCLPGPHDAQTALVTVGTIGGLTWLAAIRSGPSRRAANDNDPGPLARFDWQPTDPHLTAVIPANAGIQSQAKQTPLLYYPGS